MANPILGQILGSVLGGAAGQRGGSAIGGGLPTGLPGGLGSLGGMPGGGALGGGRNAMLMLLLPLVMQWVQRSGGLGNVLGRARQHGYGRHADSWVSTGENESIDSRAVGDLMGPDELSRMSRELGVDEQEAADGVAEILPQVVDQLSPQGQVAQDADDRLGGALAQLQSRLTGFR